MTGSATRRFVQLFTDGHRSSARAFCPAATRWEALPGSAGAVQRETLVAAVAALLYRYTQQEDIALDLYTVDSTGRDPAGLDLAVAGAATISQLAAATRAASPPAAALPGLHAGLPTGSGERANVAVTVIAAEAAPATLAPADVVALPAVPPYDLHFVLAQSAGDSRIAVVYDAGLLAAPTVRQMIESYTVMLAGALQAPATSIDVLGIVGPAARDALVHANSGGGTADAAASVHRSFEALAKKQPSATAAVFQGRSITYRELDERSSQLANYLVTQGTAPGAAVAVCIRPCLEILVAILAIWKARAIYLPLDPTHPPALIGRMLEEARPAQVLTSSDLAALTATAAQLHLDVGAAILDAYPVMAPPNEPHPDDGAYLFYTSGTTGRPKGVVATQGNLAQYIHSAAGKYGFHAQDVFASVARYTFSISLFELISPLYCGASVRLLGRDEVLSPPRLQQALETVTVLHAGPSLLGSLFRHLRSLAPEGGTLPRMRHASSGGDIVAASMMEDMKVFFPGAELFVIYGCTEISCMGTTFEVPRHQTVDRSYVGRPFPNVTLQVVDSIGALVPFGVAGEICFAGAGVVPGYLHRPDLTAEKFIDRDAGRFYRTGDIGRLHPDGNLEILGRRDFQVKIRGIRIELGGIEKVVIEQELATQCAVVARTFGPGDVRLVAYVVKPSDPSPQVLRRALAAQLPDYMVPGHVVTLDAMPLTVNGKLDRLRLMELPVDVAEPGVTGGVPADPHVERIARAFASVLHRADVPGDVSFFDLGGDSLLAVALLEEIRNGTGIAVPPSVLFDSGTVNALADQIRNGATPHPRPILLNTPCPGPALFMLSGVHIYRELARRLDGRCPAYGVFTQRELGAFTSSHDEHSVRALARDYLEVIRAQQPVGPYRLLGYSFAGIVAYEVAQQIRASGDEVSVLALVDTYLPEWLRGWRYRFDQLARLASAPPRDVFQFVVQRLRGRHVGDDDAGRHHHEQETGHLEQRRNRVNLAAAAQYMQQVAPFDGRVNLIVSSTRLHDDPLKDPSGGWSPYVRQLDIQAVDGHHLRMISDEPHVTAVAAILARCL